MAKRRGGYISIDVDTVIDAIDDDVLLAEVQSRKLSINADGEITDLQMLRQAYDELRCGRSAEALTILDRLINPKWPTVDACTKAYAATRGVA